MMNMRFLLTVIVLFRLSVFEMAWADEINKDYRLGSGDVIKVSVYEYPDLTTEIRVSETGNINFPLLGEVSLGGKTVAEAERLIAGRLNDGDFIKAPQVTLVVTRFVSQKVNVLGLVNKPGIYSLEVSGHVIDLLAQAGGITEVPPAADFATLLHSNGSKVTIDLNALLAGDRTQNYAVANGDVIVVPRAPMFYIYGEVQRPGSYKLEKNMSIAQAISAGGGLTPKGAESWPAPIVKRRDAEGKEQEIDVEDVSLLQADDVLYVKESWL